MRLEFQKSEAGGVLRLSGRVTIEDAEQLLEWAKTCSKEDQAVKLGLDLSDIEILDTAALQILLALRHRLESGGGSIAFVASSPTAEELLRRSGWAA